MYGGVGLPSAKGSGTNAYVQKSLAFVNPKIREDNENYKEIIEKFRKDPVKPQRKVNADIVRHELKHKIEEILFDYKEELISCKKLSPEEAEKEIIKKRKKLLNEFLNNKTKNNMLYCYETHCNGEIKEEILLQMKDILKIKDDYRLGEGF